MVDAHWGKSLVSSEFPVDQSAKAVAGRVRMVISCQGG